MNVVCVCVHMCIHIHISICIYYIYIENQEFIIISSFPIDNTPEIIFLFSLTIFVTLFPMVGNPLFFLYLLVWSNLLYVISFLGSDSSCWTFPLCRFPPHPALGFDAPCHVVPWHDVHIPSSSCLGSDVLNWIIHPFGTIVLTRPQRSFDFSL